MRRVALVVFALFALAPSVRAQEEDIASDALQAGRSALQFEIDDGFFISGFEGTTLSYKRMVSERAAWRIGITYGGATAEGDESSRALIDSSFVPDAEFADESNDFGVGASVLHQRYLWGRNRVRPYLGFGGFVGYNYYEVNEEGRFFVPFEVRRRVERENSRWQYGARALLGAEVFVSRSVSILGQYSTSISRFTSDDRFSIVDSAPEIPPGEVHGIETERSNEGWRFGDNRVSLGLSAYF
jgi:hypothetical protein